MLTLKFRSSQLQSRDFRFCIIDPESWGLKLKTLMEMFGFNIMEMFDSFAAVFFLGNVWSFHNYIMVASRTACCTTGSVFLSNSLQLDLSMLTLKLVIWWSNR